MPISFEYPVVYFYSDDPEDADISYCEGAVWPINFDREPYEMTLDAQGCSFHLIFGSQINGRFLCIPDWQFGCELARFTDQSWNLNSILEKDSRLDYEDATAIVYALDLVSTLIN